MLRTLGQLQQAAFLTTQQVHAVAVPSKQCRMGLTQAPLLSAKMSSSGTLSKPKPLHLAALEAPLLPNRRLMPEVT
jgi:hypothetical protein